MTDYNTIHKRIYDKKWNFKDGSMKDLVHGLHPYPAMMMPLIARTMFEKYGKGKETIFMDPYVGSGTTIVEAQRYGVSQAIGIDLNPLAILISKVKTQNINLILLKSKIDSYDDFIKNVRHCTAPEFSIRDSWFSKQVIDDLAKIKEFVSTIEEEGLRDFFNMSFSEVIRASSETRNGEFKLYRMSKKSLAKFNPQPIKMFSDVILRNYEILKKADYDRNTNVILLNENTINLINHKNFSNKVDLIITSPPYGDSHTTVAYGQFSRLANEWLGVKNACSLDKQLLGGTRVKEKKFNIQELDEAIQMIKEKDVVFNRDRYWEVISFYDDYEKSLKAVACTVKVGGYVIYVVGNRRVRNIELPMDIITYKMFEKMGFEHIITHVRDILNKRMPSKASPSNEKGEQIPTMTNEYIVVMKRIK